MDLEKGTFISSVSPYPEEEYYLGKSSWSSTASDWDQRFEVGDVIADPSGSWTPSTAEAYIDQQIATITGNLASETIARQTADTNLQTQINSEVTTRYNADQQQSTRIDQLRVLYENLTQSDIVVGTRPSSGQLTNVIYREPDQGHTPPQFYADYLWYSGAWVLMAQYDNAIDDEPTVGSNNLVKSGGVAGYVSVSQNTSTRHTEISIGDEINTIPSLQDIGIIETTWSAGAILTDGTKVDSTAWNVSNDIYLREGQSLVFSVDYTEGGVAALSLRNGSTYTAIELSNSSVTTIEYTAINNCIVVLCKRVNAVATVNASVDVVEMAFDNKNEINSVKASNDIQDRTINNLNPAIFENLTPIENSGYIEANNGNVVSHPTFKYTNKIALKKGDTIILYGRGYNTDVAIISISDDSANLPIISSIDSQIRKYTYTAPMAMYVRLCYDTDANTKITLIKGNTISPAISDSIKVYDNSAIIGKVKYMLYNDTYYAHTNYVVSSPIKLLKWQTIKANLRVESVVTAIEKCQSDGTLIESLVMGVGIMPHDYSYTAQEDEYVCISFFISESYKDDFSCILTYPVYNNISNEVLGNFSMFENWGVIGDSFASGVFINESTGNLDNNLQKSWGQIIARQCGNTCINFSMGGLYCGSWLTQEQRGLPFLLQSAPQELYIIGLGINDVGHLSIDQPLGTIADIKEDFTENPYTFYGNYGKIIGNIQSHAPKAKIILMTIPYNSTNAMSINNAIIAIAELFGFPCMNVHEDKFFRSSYFWDNFEQDHPKSFLYGMMANVYLKMFCKSLKNDTIYWGDTFN